MTLGIDDNGTIELKEVHNEIKLISSNGETMYINMRDGGFEFVYEGIPYQAKGGTVEPLNKNNELMDYPNAEEESYREAVMRDFAPQRYENE